MRRRLDFKFLALVTIPFAIIGIGTHCCMASN